MQHGVRIEAGEEKDFLHLALHGDFPVGPAEQTAFYQDILAAMEGSARSRVLVDVRGMGRRLDLPGIFEYVVRTHPDPVPQPQTRRIAILDLPENLGKDYFYETLVQNRGLDYKIFKDEGLARAWLLA